MVKYSEEELEQLRESDAKLLRRFAPVTIRYNRSRFEDTGNSVYVWRAYRAARRLGGDLPDWIFSYLDDCADGLLHLAFREKTTNSDKQYHEVAEAINFGPDRSRTHLKRHETERRDLKLASEVLEDMSRHEIGLDKAAQSVAASNKVHRETVKTAFRRHEKLLRTSLRDI